MPKLSSTVGDDEDLNATDYIRKVNQRVILKPSLQVKLTFLGVEMGLFHLVYFTKNFENRRFKMKKD